MKRSDLASIERVAREQLKEGLPRLLVKQAWTEFLVSARRRLCFRERENARAVRAYCAMSVAEFEAVNARQRWANWRTVPRNLRGRLPDRPCRAVDLCSGVGDSAQVLAYYLPAGSTILGLEYNPEFVRRARGRTYLGAGGAPVAAEFHAQSVLEPFRDSADARLPDGSVDLVNACGSLAIHFNEPALNALAAEIFRVLRPGGLAAIDAEGSGPGRERMLGLFRRHGFEPLGGARSCVFDRFIQLCFRRL